LAHAVSTGSTQGTKQGYPESSDPVVGEKIMNESGADWTDLKEQSPPPPPSSDEWRANALAFEAGGGDRSVEDFRQIIATAREEAVENERQARMFEAAANRGDEAAELARTRKEAATKREAEQVEGSGDAELVAATADIKSAVAGATVETVNDRVAKLLRPPPMPVPEDVGVTGLGAQLGVQVAGVGEGGSANLQMSELLPPLRVAGPTVAVRTAGKAAMGLPHRENRWTGPVVYRMRAKTDAEKKAEEAELQRKERQVVAADQTRRKELMDEQKRIDGRAETEGYRSDGGESTSTYDGLLSDRSDASRGSGRSSGSGIWRECKRKLMHPQERKTMTTIQLSWAGLGPDEARELVDLIKETDHKKEYVRNLVLRENNLGAEGARIIGELLACNRHIRKVDLHSNQIGDEGVIHIAEAITMNRGLKHIDLGGNNGNFSAESWTLVCAAAQKNKTLRSVFSNMFL
jgi:hypothetical protein